MRDGEHAPSDSLALSLHRAAQCLLRRQVDGCRGLIQQQNTRLTEQRSRQTEQLSLPLREISPSSNERPAKAFPLNITICQERPGSFDADRLGIYRQSAPATNQPAHRPPMHA